MTFEKNVYLWGEDTGDLSSEYLDELAHCIEQFDPITTKYGITELNTAGTHTLD